MKNQLLKKKQKSVQSLKIELQLIQSEIKKLEIKKKVVLTVRNKQFRRDDAQPLVNKYKNKKYENYKADILIEVRRKFELAKVQKEKKEKIYAIYDNFISENETEQLF